MPDPKMPGKSQLRSALYRLRQVIPAKKVYDARHVAIATVSGMNILVSWNHRHLANARKKELFNAVNRLAGFDKELVIHTPLEVMQ